MSFEDEKIEHELKQLGNNDVILADSNYSQFVLNSDFKSQFLLIPESVCTNCGQIFRITHHCDSSEVDEWLPGWEKMIRTLFESHEKQEKLLEETQKQEEDLQKLNEESKLRWELAKVQLKNEQLRKELGLVKQNTAKISNKPSYSNLTNTRTTYRGGKKLILDSITQLNPQERKVYEQLRLWRNSQAKNEHTKPYIIAHNTALMAIVYYKVSSLRELMRISGFSERKADKYGPAIVGIMRRNGMAYGIKKPQANRISGVNSSKSSYKKPFDKNPIYKNDTCFAFSVLLIFVIIGILPH